MILSCVHCDRGAKSQNKKGEKNRRKANKKGEKRGKKQSGMHSKIQPKNDFQ